MMNLFILAQSGIFEPNAKYLMMIGYDFEMIEMNGTMFIHFLF